jgi:hypothetical protein
MERLHEQIDPDGAFKRQGQPTRFKTAENVHELACSMCGSHYFVDDAIYRRYRSALDYDPSADPFCCEACEDLEGEEEHR